MESEGQGGAGETQLVLRELRGGREGDTGSRIRKKRSRMTMKMSKRERTGRKRKSGKEYVTKHTQHVK